MKSLCSVFFLFMIQPYLSKAQHLEMIAYGAVGQKISSISESKDGQSFLTTSGDNIISVWFKNGRFEELAQASDKPYSFAVFSPATSVFLAGGPQVKAKCWVDYSV